MISFVLYQSPLYKEKELDNFSTSQDTDMVKGQIPNKWMSMTQSIPQNYFAFILKISYKVILGQCLELTHGLCYSDFAW